MICECGASEWTWSGGTQTTCVGYFTPDDDELGPHDHDDNCKFRCYICASCGERAFVTAQARCPNPGCDWVGKGSCFCHEGEKAEHWPVAKVVKQ